MFSSKKVVILATLGISLFKFSGARSSIAPDCYDISNIIEYQFDKQKIDSFFEEDAKSKDVDVKALKGEYLEPYPFWSQPINEILKFLLPIIKKYKIHEYIDACANRCYYDPDASPYPLDVERDFENDVEEMLREFAVANGIATESFNFKESLKIGRENGDKKEFSDVRIPSTPLFSFLEPYFITFEDAVSIDTTH